MFYKAIVTTNLQMKMMIEKKGPIVNLTTAKQVLLQNLYKQVVCP